MWRWLRGTTGFSYLEGYTQPQKQGSHVETRGVLFCASGNPHILVLETRPLKSDVCKPNLGFRLGSRGI